MIDALDRLDNFRSEVTNSVKTKLMEIQATAVPFGADSPTEQPPIKQFYDFTDFNDAAKYSDKELPRDPEPAHVQADNSVSDRIKWQYHYLQSLFGSGTHYIVLEKVCRRPWRWGPNLRTHPRGRLGVGP